VTARLRACALALLAAAALGACDPAPEPATAPTPARVSKAPPSADLGEELRAFDRDVLERLRRLPDRHLIPEERKALAKGTTLNAPATPADLDALAARIGKPLPPSYRAFLEATDGMLYVAPLNVVTMLSASAVAPFTAEKFPGIGIWLAMADVAVPLEPTAGGPLPGPALARAWVISSVEDGDVYFIFPDLAGANGEWPVWFFGPKNPGAYGYRSFGDMLARERAAALRELDRRGL
jgi:hypothetical protein